METLSRHCAPPSDQVSAQPSAAQPFEAQLEAENQELHAYLHTQRVIVSSLERRVGHSLESLAEHVQRLTIAAQDDQSWQQQLTYVQNEVDCLSDLLADTLLLQRLEAGKVQVKRELLDIQTLLRGVTRHLLKPDQSQWSRLICEIDPLLPSAYVDQELTEAVLTDLLGRALRYSDGSAPIALMATTIPGQIELRVTAQHFAPPGNRDFATEIMLCCRRVEVQGGTITCEQHPNRLQTVVIVLPAEESKCLLRIG